MAFPTSGLTNNLVHKEGNRAFVYDSALGVWDQVRETDKTENKIIQGELGSGVTFPAGHVLQTVSTNYTGQVTDSISVDTDTKIDEITASITVKVGNDVQIQISAFGELSGTTAEAYINAVVYRNSTVLKAPVVGNRTSVMTSDASSNMDSNPYITPNTINILYTDKALAAGTYNYYLGIVTSNGGGTYYTNRSVNDTDSTIHTRGVSTVTLMEIQR